MSRELDDAITRHFLGLEKEAVFSTEYDLESKNIGGVDYGKYETQTDGFDANDRYKNLSWDGALGTVASNTAIGAGVGAAGGAAFGGVGAAPGAIGGAMYGAAQGVGEAAVNSNPFFKQLWDKGRSGLSSMTGGWIGNSKSQHLQDQEAAYKAESDKMMEDSRASMDAEWKNKAKLNKSTNA